MEIFEYFFKNGRSLKYIYRKLRGVYGQGNRLYENNIKRMLEDVGNKRIFILSICPLVFVDNKMGLVKPVNYLKFNYMTENLKGGVFKKNGDINCSSKSCDMTQLDNNLLSFLKSHY